MARKPVSKENQEKVLVQSARRCCICFGLHGRFDEVQGQIAHLDGNNENNDLENLAFLCLPCHERYDSTTSQSKGLTIEEAKRYRDMLHEQVRKWRNEQKPQLISDFPDLAHQIWPLMTENRRAFTSYGPRSGAESAAPVRWDLSLWEEAKADIILPNNQRIREIIENSWNHVPEEYQPIFEKMLAHIYAFEKHCHKPTIDYTEHQFPQDFASMIDDICAQEAEKETDIGKIGSWLATELSAGDLSVVQGYLIGSVLRGTFEGSDVDAFLLLDDATPDEIRASGQKLERLKQRFFSEFGRPLHSVVFSQPENEEFHEFLENLARKRRFI